MILTLLLAAALAAQEPPAWKTRLEAASRSPEAWAARRGEIRTQILVSAGLWPMFTAPGLEPQVTGRIEREGYTVEKVRLKTGPDFYLTGNLYRPRGKTGPFPGIVSPHGHWKEGRYADQKEGSIAGRAITLARLGFVVFSYDMVGYGDLKQVPHKFEENGWGVGLLGLQLWNSLRAVDFLVSLPEVDPKRIGATGESGGGTQTFLLAAVDDRIACAVPVCMVAAEFQGGCSCENAPFLRIDLNNVEIAAACAPRPLMLVAATGDWTKHNPTLEGPAIHEAYKKLGVGDRFRCVQFEAPHNYNRESREAVYAWFARWLQGAPDAEKIAEPPFTVEKREDLAVPPAAGAADAATLAASVREAVRRQLEELQPRDKESLARFREIMLPALQYSLSARWGPPAAAFGGDKAVTLVVTSGPVEIEPAEHRHVLSLKPHDREVPAGGNKDQRAAYPATFHRTALAWQVQDVLDEMARLAALPHAGEIRIVGVGEAGPPALFAAALASRVAHAEIDVNGLDEIDVKTHPGMRRIAALRTAAILVAAQGKLILHNTQGKFDPAWVREAVGARVEVDEKPWPGRILK